jgi:hypothetical protein
MCMATRQSRRVGCRRIASRKLHSQYIQLFRHWGRMTTFLQFCDCTDQHVAEWAQCMRVCIQQPDAEAERDGQRGQNAGAGLVGDQLDGDHGHEETLRGGVRERCTRSLQVELKRRNRIDKSTLSLSTRSLQVELKRRNRIDKSTLSLKFKRTKRMPHAATKTAPIGDADRAAWATVAP